jgi:hypothetical protein
MKLLVKDDRLVGNNISSSSSAGGLANNNNNNNNTVTASSMMGSSTSSTAHHIIMAELQPECSIAENVLVLYLKSYPPDCLLVGDIQRSISLLRYKSNESNIEEIARDPNINLMRSIESLHPSLLNGRFDVFLGTDDHGNLFSLKYRRDLTVANLPAASTPASAAAGGGGGAGAAGTGGGNNNTNAANNANNIANTVEEERYRLQLLAEYHIGDHVNVMRRGSLIVQPIGSTAGNNGNSSSGGVGVNSSSTVDGPSLMVIEGSTTGATTNTNTTATNATTSSSTIAADDTIIDIFSPQYRTVTGYPTEHNSILFGTISGALGNIFALNESSYQFFLAVQTVMRRHATPIIGLLHEDWRTFVNDYRTSNMKNIIDGDLVESLLDMDRQKLVLIVKEINDELTSMMLTSSNPNPHNTTSMMNQVSGSESTSALIHHLATNRIQFTVEEIISRIEDIARLH